MLSTHDYDLICISAIEEEVKEMTSHDLSFYHDMSDEELLDVILKIANMYQLMAELKAKYA